eukprot:3780235-Rhodomonas_salina.1
MPVYIIWYRYAGTAVPPGILVCSYTVGQTEMARGQYTQASTPGTPGLSRNTAPCDWRTIARYRADVYAGDK